ncbi:MAG: MarR family transcriptional regulator [Crenarchaeota archaeon]|nr:MarR family transcriptional regulator [Thermoproteota archaeon]
MSELKEVERLVRFAEKISEDRSYSIKELASIWSLDEASAKKVLRKLRREGFVRRTRSGRYKLSLAGRVIVKIFKMVRR